MSEQISTIPTDIADLATDPFWSGKLYTDGVLDKAKVAAELMDFAVVWRTLGRVIDERADGMTGCYKLYTAEAIIQQIDAWKDKQVEADRAETLENLACSLEAQADFIESLHGPGVPDEFIAKHNLEANQLRFVARLARAGGDFDWNTLAIKEMEESVTKAFLDRALKGGGQ